jgi:hypothetical protein
MRRSIGRFGVAGRLAKGGRDPGAAGGPDPGARGVTRRLFLDGGLKASIAAGVAGRLSLLDLLASPGQPHARRLFDGEMIEESYGIAHRLRDGSLSIPNLTPEGPLHDAIVLGGGVSGLMAAWDLARSGLDDVLLYEKENYIGGNARKGHANGTDYTAATWSLVRPKTPFLTRLYQDLDMIAGFAADGTPKIRPELVGNEGDSNMLVDGTWYRDATTGGDPKTAYDHMPLPEKDRRDLTAFYEEMHSWPGRKGRDGRPAFAMPVEEGSRDPEILELDRIPMAAYVRKKGWSERAFRHADDWSSSTIGGGIADVSAYAFWSFNSLGQGGEDIMLPGGNAWVAQRMADKVGRDRIHQGLTAVRVANEGSEARVTFVDPFTERFSMRRARAVVIACPKHITGRMVPEMGVADRTLWRDLRYGALLMGAASVKRTPVLKGAPIGWYNWGDGKLMQGFLVGDYNSDRWRQGDPSRPNVLCLWAPLDGRATRAELLEKPWSHWADRLADDLEFMVPGIHRDLTRLDVHVWGHHMVIPYPGLLTGEARGRMCRPLGRIAFAHSDRHGMPSYELATHAGHLAAQEALKIARA